MQELFSNSGSVALPSVYDAAMKKAYSAVGCRIAALRKERGFSQRALADKLKTSPSNVGYWETYAPAPPGEVLPTLSAIFGVSVDELLGVKPSKPKALPVRGRLQQVFEEASRLPRRQQQKVAEFIQAFVRQSTANA